MTVPDFRPLTEQQQRRLVLAVPHGVTAVRRRLRDALFSLSDRICARAGAGTDEGVTRPWLFEAGHQVGEFGWKLR